MMFNPVEIVKIFASCPKISKAVIFGTNANGIDDVDVALFGDIDADDFEHIADALGELPIKQKFDIVAYDMVTDTELREVIDKSGVVVYESGNGVFLSSGADVIPKWELVQK